MEKAFFTIVKSYQNITKIGIDLNDCYSYGVDDALVGTEIFTSFYDARDEIRKIKNQFFKEDGQWTDVLEDAFFITIGNVYEEQIRITYHIVSLYTKEEDEL